MARLSRDPKVRASEKYPDFLNKHRKKGLGHIPNTIYDPQYKIKLAALKYDQFINAGDYHYFIGRILFLSHTGTYGFFCAQQCIENYLKAYLVFRGAKVKTTHNLGLLLRLCKAIAPKKSFLSTKRADVIISQFDAYNELPRYALAKRGPDSNYGYIIPNDYFNVDYFIYRMRKEIPLPLGVWDVLKEGKPYGAGFMENQDLLNLFKQENINF